MYKNLIFNRDKDEESDIYGFVENLRLESQQDVQSEKNNFNGIQ